MPSPDEIAAPPAAGSQPEGVEAWSEYAKERYESAEKRLADLRAWARQLAAAAAVVVGLEVALVIQLPKVPGLPVLALTCCVVLLLAGAAYQLYVLNEAVHQGYVGQEVIGPESPSVLATYVADAASTRQMIGAYYSKGYDSIYARAETVARRVSILARHFVRSAWLLFASLLLTTGLVAVSSDWRKAMTENPPAPGPAVPAQPDAGTSAPAAAAPAPSPTPAPSPLLATPTPGQTETHAAQPPREPFLATPTPGQTLTEAQGGKR